MVKNIYNGGELMIGARFEVNSALASASQKIKG